MTQLKWDEVGEHLYETGLDHGVLYLPDSQGVYDDGVAWNGLTALTESPSGAEANAWYADNIKYINAFSIEEFGATLEAMTYPDEFSQFDGYGSPTPGIQIGQQYRKTFGLSYRTLIGNDLQADGYGFKIHLLYGCKASPSEKNFTTINDSPEHVALSWAISTTPVPVTGMKPTSRIEIDSTKVDADSMTDLLQILYGTNGVDPRLPSPDEVVALFAGTVVTVSPTMPAYNSTTHTITIPNITGVTYYINDSAVAAGAVVITQDTLVESRPDQGYNFPNGVDDDWFYDYT